MKKTLLAVAALAAISLAFVSCGDPEDPDTPVTPSETTKDITYKGEDLKTFLGISSGVVVNDDSSITITTVGWTTNGTLETPIDYTKIRKIVVVAENLEDSHKGYLKFYASEEDATKTVIETSFNDFYKTDGKVSLECSDFSKFEKNIDMFQVFLQNTSTWDADNGDVKIYSVTLTVVDDGTDATVPTDNTDNTDNTDAGAADAGV